MPTNIQQLVDRSRAACAALRATADGSAERDAVEAELFAADEAVIDAVASSPSEMALQLQFIADDDANMLDDPVKAALARIAAGLRAMDAPAPTAA